MTVAVPGLVGATGHLADVRDRSLRQDPLSAVEGSENIVAPMQGTLVELAVVDGQQVSAGDLIAVVEAMKMENPVRAPHGGHIVDLAVRAGDNVVQGAAMCSVVRRD